MIADIMMDTMVLKAQQGTSGLVGNLNNFKINCKTNSMAVN